MNKIAQVVVLVLLVAYLLTAVITGSILWPISIPLEWICSMGGMDGLAACQ